MTVIILLLGNIITKMSAAGVEIIYTLLFRERGRGGRKRSR